jgi:hypothetical protein
MNGCCGIFGALIGCGIAAEPMKLGTREGPLGGSLGIAGRLQLAARGVERRLEMTEVASGGHQIGGENDPVLVGWIGGVDAPLGRGRRDVGPELVKAAQM